MSYVLALAAALHAFGAHASLLTVAAAYLAGAAIASASPLRGGSAPSSPPSSPG